MATYAIAATSGRRLLRALDRPSDAFAYIGPNWFASVMGTGIVANAAASLPVRIPGLIVAAQTVWLLAAGMLAALSVATIIHWTLHRETARSHLRNPVLGHFYGAPPMAMLTVGAGALLVGYSIIGMRAAVDLDWVLWTTGTIAGLVTAVAVPYAMFTRHHYRPDAAFGGWLMPVVPPMVSAATGALLVPHVAGHQAQAALIYGCYAMFGLSLIASIVIITLVGTRLAQNGIGPSNLVPTLWIVLGPLGQSVTAAGLLAKASQDVLSSAYKGATADFALLYGIPVLGFAALWFTLAAAITLKTARLHLPFGLTWWSFTFPIGTCVTAVNGLAARTGLDAFRDAAVGLFAILVAAWATVAVRTFLGTISGQLLVPSASLTMTVRKMPPGRRSSVVFSSGVPTPTGPQK